jgi:DNA-binding response OmpR family regulator
MGAEARVLLVEDDVDLAELSARFLRRNGFVVDVASSGQRALELAEQRPPDIALLDVQLPDMDGLEVLEQLKAGADEPAMPVLFLTGARLAPGDQVIGLERGAVDYISKDVDRQVLLARIRSALRARTRGVHRIRKGPLFVDAIEGRVELDGRRIDLDRKPLLVLFELMKSGGRPVSRDELLRSVWNTDYEAFDRSIDQAVYTLRKSLGHPEWVATVRHYGYRLDLPS